MGLAGDLLEDARHLAAKGAAENRKPDAPRHFDSVLRGFHLLVEDFVGSWPFIDQRPQLAPMFSHRTIRDAAFSPADKDNPSPIETALVDVKTGFSQLQADRHRADYDLGWKIVETDVTNALTLAEYTFAKWRTIRDEDIARQHLLLMFGGKR